MNLLRSAAPFIGALAAGVCLAVLAVLLNVASPSLGFIAGFCAAVVALVVNSALHAAVPIAPLITSSPDSPAAERPSPRPRPTTAQAHPPAVARPSGDRNGERTSERGSERGSERSSVDRQSSAAAATRATTTSTSSDAHDDAPLPAGPRAAGNVKWFNRTKGYGFIQCDDGQEVFVHHRNLRGVERQALRDGERVSFAIVERNRGPQAEDVTVVVQ